MSIRRDPRNGGWFFRATAKRADGKRVRIYGTPGVPGPYQDLPTTKIGAQAAEDRAKAHALTGTVPAGVAPPAAAAEKEVPTYRDWFNGRFWDEWVIAERNKPSEREAKRSIFRTHLDPVLGELPLDEIGAAEVQKLRAHLVSLELGEKRINNVMAVLSKSLRYAVDAEVIATMPRIRFRKVERPAIEAWSFEEYPRILIAAREESPEWYAAACLAMEWMGHKRIDETMGYVHSVERKPRPIPDEIVHAGQGHVEPSARVLAMLGARAPWRGSHVAASPEVR